MSQWLCGKRAWLNDISLIAPLGSLPSSWSIPRSNCPRLTLTSHKIGRNCQKNGRYWDQEVDLLTFTYNLHQLTTSWISWNLLNMPEHLNRHSNHDGLKLQRYDFRLLLSSHFQKQENKTRDTAPSTLEKHVLNLVMSMTGISDLSWASLIPGTASIMSFKVPSQKIFC